MKLENARENYYYNTGKASDIVRQLALAGVALVWIFKSGEGSTYKLPSALNCPTQLILITLILDFLQYVIGGAMWGGFSRSKENETGICAASEFRAPRWINWPALVAYWGKVVTVLVAYILLLQFLSRTIIVN